MMLLRKCYRGVLLVVCLVMIWPFQSSAREQSVCGVWQIRASDAERRLEATMITSGSGSDCHAALRFANSTEVFGFGGYTLELMPYTTQNATFTWAPSLAAHGDQGLSADLLPSLDIELHAVPVEVSSHAQIAIVGAMTPRSWTADVSLFLLRAGLELAPPGGSCLIQDEQLAYSAIRVSSILGTASGLALKGDLLGAKQEFTQVAGEFYTRAGEALKEIGLDCAGDALEELAKKPVVMAKIGLAYATWVPVAIYDFLKYHGVPAEIAFEYIPTSPAPTSSPPPIPTPSPVPTIRAIATMTPALFESQVTVDGKLGWQDSGVQVSERDHLTVRYVSGQWANNVNGQYVDANGYPGFYPSSVEGVCGQAPMPNEQNGALIGQIGNGPAFLIGNHLSFIADRSGMLSLRMNDADACMTDNGGSIMVNIDLLRQ